MMNINILKSRELNDVSVRVKQSTINTTHLGYVFVMLTMKLKKKCFNRLTCIKVTGHSNPPQSLLCY